MLHFGQFWRDRIDRENANKGGSREIRAWKRAAWLPVIRARIKREIRLFADQYLLMVFFFVQIRKFSISVILSKSVIRFSYESLSSRKLTNFKSGTTGC